MLATLAQFEEMGAKAIGAHASMHKAKVSRAVRALEERRWLKRRTCEGDRREAVLSLMPLGRRAYGYVVPRALAFEAKIVEALGSEAGPVLRGLERLEDAFSESR